MLNQRGSALLNVLAVVAMLLILGFGLMQAVNSDFLLAIRDADVTHAIQMAEGGIDYGLEMLVAGPEEVLGQLNWPEVGSGVPFLIEVEEGEVGVTIEEIVPEKQFLITSRSVRENAARQIKAYITHYGDIANPFSYSLFVGGQGGDPAAEWDLILKNLTIHGSVYIASDRVKLENVKFNGDVHFASSYVWVEKAELNVLQATATREEYTVIEGKINASHWASQMEVVSDIQAMPDVAIPELTNIDGFYSWTATTVNFSELKRLNYFPGDVTIVFQDGQNPTEVKMVVACNGSVTFQCANGQYHPDQRRTLIVMAEGDISGVERISNKASNQPKVDLYLYSKGSIITEQNIYVSSIMAQWISVHNQNYTVHAPNPAIFDDLPDALREAWGISGFKITWWEN